MWSLAGYIVRCTLFPMDEAVCRAPLTWTFTLILEGTLWRLLGSAHIRLAFVHSMRASFPRYFTCILAASASLGRDPAGRGPIMLREASCVFRREREEDPKCRSGQEGRYLRGPKPSPSRWPLSKLNKKLKFKTSTVHYLTDPILFILSNSSAMNTHTLFVCVISWLLKKNHPPSHTTLPLCPPTNLPLCCSIRPTFFPPWNEVSPRIDTGRRRGKPLLPWQAVTKEGEGERKKDSQSLIWIARSLVLLYQHHDFFSS